jgi:hypothetical protein
MSAATGSTNEVLRIARMIKPLLAGYPPGVQGAVLAELLSIWLAANTINGGDELMETALTIHVEAVRKLVPININLLSGGGSRDRRGH